jgi:hypothetical protein
MVTPAQQGEIVQGRRSTIGPMTNVMPVAAACGAAGKVAAAVARQQCAADRGRDRPRLATDIEHGTIHRVAHDDDRSVARDAP